MPEYDGKVHISTGVYWGFLVAYLGYYSTFVSFTVWVLIHTYYTQPTYQTILNALASTFYDRIIGPSLEKIVNEYASSGVTDFITGAVLFVITALKSILRPSRIALSLETSGPPSKTPKGGARPDEPQLIEAVDTPISPPDPEPPSTNDHTSPQTHQLRSPIDVPVLRPPVPPKIKISSLR